VPLKLHKNIHAIRAVQEFYASSSRQKYQVIGVYAIQNESLWNQHKDLEKNWIKSGRLSEKTLNIQMLWHGTGIKVVKQITEKGFMRDYNARCTFGKGVYFAKESEYSIDENYAKFDDKNQCTQLLYCRVICGESVIGAQSYVRPPDKTSNKCQEYETMVNNTSNPTVYVACNDHQCYPYMKLIIKRKKEITFMRY